MRKVSIVIGLCVIAALALSIAGQAQQARAISDIMKEIQATNVLLTTTDVADATKAGADAAKLQSLFMEADAFFVKEKVDDASKMAKELAAAAGDVAKAAKGGKAPDPAALKTNIGSKCKTCHDIHKEKDPANPGGFRLKK